jgi:cytochrome c6
VQSPDARSDCAGLFQVVAVISSAIAGHRSCIAGGQDQAAGARLRTGQQKEKEYVMQKMIRSQIVLAATLALACAMGFADDGAAIYKAKCAMCHGATGTPNPGMAKAMGIQAVSDPAMKALSVDQVAAAVKNGKGKMKPVAGLSDADVKSVSEFFKTLK